jgi:hypothetical protein
LSSKIEGGSSLLDEKKISTLNFDDPKMVSVERIK